MGKSTVVLTLLMGIIFCSPVMAHNNSYTLEDALRKKLVTAEISGRKDATTNYYGQCITIKIKNTSGQSLSLNLESGRRLNCEYDSIQDMLITKAEIFALLPGQVNDYTIYAMCCQQHDHSPGSTTKFNLGAMAQSQLVQLAMLIEKLSAQDYAGQRAVWVITDDADPDMISSDNEEVTKALKEFVINVIKNKKTADRDPGFTYDYSYPTTDGNVFTIEGDFDFEMPYQTFVSLYVYNNNGDRVKIVFQDVAFSGGLQTYHYKLSDAVFESGETYWLRLKQNSKTVKEVAVTMD